MERILWTLAISFAGAFIAKRRKLNPFFWFAVCYMLGSAALLSLIFFPFFLKKWNKKKAEPAPLPSFSSAFPPQSLWYHLDEEERQNGPVSFVRLQEMMKEGTIQENTYIWNESFTKWRTWKSVFSEFEGK